MPDASAREEEAQPPTGQAGVAVPLEALEDPGGAHAAADAHGDEAVAAVPPLQLPVAGPTPPVWPQAAFVSSLPVLDEPRSARAEPA